MSEKEITMDQETREQIEAKIRLAKWYRREATKRANNARGPQAAQSATRAAARHAAEIEALEKALKS